jgi:hypothetical protein
MKRTRLIPILALPCLLAACGGDADTPAARADARASAATSPPAAAARAAGGDASPASAATGTADNLAALRQEVALLRAEVRDVRDQVSRMPGASQAAAAAPDPRTDPMARQEAQQAERLRIASSESTFQGERRDARWAQDTTAAIQSSLTQADDAIRAQVRSIDCRSQSCRVEIGSAAGPALAQQLPMVIAQLGASLPHVTAGQVDQGDGSQATVLYLSR